MFFPESPERKGEKELTVARQPPSAWLGPTSCHVEPCTVRHCQ